MSDDIPTQRFDQPPTTPVGAQPPSGEKNSRRLLVILIVVGAVLLIAIIVIVALLLDRSGGGATPTPTPTTTHSATPTPTPTPTHTPTPTPTPTQTTPPPPPPSTTPTVTSFTVSSPTVTCSASGGVQDPQLAFSWTSTNAAQAYFGVDTTNAQQNPFFGQALSPNGDSTSFPAGYNPFEYSCKAPNHTYTITVVGNGQSASKSITVTNIGAK